MPKEVSTKLRAMWLSYRNKVIPVSAPAIQVEECRRAFYAGAASFLDAQQALLTAGLDVTEDEVAGMELLYQELMDFAEGLRRTHAK